MKTFTVRDLDRSPGIVLEAADAEGAVLVRCRDGRAYRISPERSTLQPAKTPDFAAWRRQTGMPRLNRSQTDAVDRRIAGE
ncbi:MAG: hypothetical protein U1G08_08215 [Verrucomicrobiota bacterium]